MGRQRFVPFGETTSVLGCAACYHAQRIAPELRVNRRAACGLDVGRYASMRLETFAALTPAERRVGEFVRAVAQGWRAGETGSLLLWSPVQSPPGLVTVKNKRLQVTGCGCGKTHLAIALADAAVDLGHSLKIIEEAAFIESIKATYADRPATTEAELLATVNDAWLLIIDDVGTYPVKGADWYQALLYGIINARYVSGLPLVITTNLTPADLALRLGPRTLSRLGEMALALQLDGPDRRLIK